jgi:tetratricopeptide (TPR) repeat protein
MTDPHGNRGDLRVQQRQHQTNNNHHTSERLRPLHASLEPLSSQQLVCQQQVQEGHIQLSVNDPAQQVDGGATVTEADSEYRIGKNMENSFNEVDESHQISGSDGGSNCSEVSPTNRSSLNTTTKSLLPFTARRFGRGITSRDNLSRIDRAKQQVDNEKPRSKLRMLPSTKVADKISLPSMPAAWLGLGPGHRQRRNLSVSRLSAADTVSTTGKTSSTTITTDSVEARPLLRDDTPSFTDDEHMLIVVSPSPSPPPNPVDSFQSSQSSLLEFEQNRSLMDGTEFGSQCLPIHQSHPSEGNAMSLVVREGSSHELQRLNSNELFPHDEIDHSPVGSKSMSQNHISPELWKQWQHLESLGLRHERAGEYDEALELYESVLLDKSQWLGDQHVAVAKALVNVGRILEEQENTEGSMDLYKAAHAIYARQPFTVHTIGDAIRVRAELVPPLLDQGRFSDVVALLHQCLQLWTEVDLATSAPACQRDKSVHISDEQQDSADKFGEIAQAISERVLINILLGKSYLGLRDYTAATICLIEATELSPDDIHQAELFELWRQVECCQRDRCDDSGYSDDNDEYSVSEASLTHDPSRTLTETISRNSSFHSIVDDQSPHLSLVDDVDERRLIATTNENDKCNLGTTEGTANGLSLTPPLATATPSIDIEGASSEDLIDGFSIAISPKSLPIDLVPDDDPPSVATSVSATMEVFVNRSSPQSSAASSSSAFPFPISRNSGVQIASSHRGRSRNENTSAGSSSVQSGPTRLSATLSISSQNTPPLRRLRLPSPRILRSNEDSNRDSKPTKPSSSKGVAMPGEKRSTFVRTLTDPFRRTRKSGFESLLDDAVDDEIADDEIHAAGDVPISAVPIMKLDEEYHSSLDVPMEFLTLPDTFTWDDEISQISFVMEDPNKQGRSPSPSSLRRDGARSEWWWSVTAEGFGRWFPSNIVSPAVEAAEGFLSAKAIHSQARKTSIHLASEDEEEEISEEESTGEDEIASKDQVDSHVGVATKKSPEDSPVREKPSADESSLLLLLTEKQAQTRAESGLPFPSLASRDVTSEIAAMRELVEKQRSTMGEDHPEMVANLFTLAILHSRNNSFDPAVASAKDALRIQKQTCNLTDGARTLRFLGDLYLHYNDYVKSLKYYEEAMQLEKEVFGYYSEEVARTLNCIGTVLSLQSKFGSAMKQHQKALRILKECVGDDLKHPLVSETLCSIGSVYYRERNSVPTGTGKTPDYSTFIEAGMLEVIGRAHEERGSFKMAISFFEEKLQFLKNRAESGDSSASPVEVATTLNSLGMLSSRAGLFAEAIEYYESAIAVQKTIGCDEVYLATARVLTGAVYLQMGEYRHAKSLIAEALVVLEKNLGRQHETVAAAKYQMGLVLCDLCDYDEAMTILEEAKSIQFNLLGPDHPATLRTRRQIGKMYAIYVAELDSAFEEFEAILTAQRVLHGENHPNVAETLHNIGCAQARQGEHSKALRTLEECYYMRVEFLGWDHPSQASTLHEIADIHLARGRVKKAMHICDVVLGIQMESLGDHHLDVARTLSTKGSCLVERGDFNMAWEQCMKPAQMIVEKAVGARHPAMADLMVHFGNFYLRKCMFKEARVSVEQALAIYREANLDEDYTGIANAVGQLQRIERDEALFV